MDLKLTEDNEWHRIMAPSDLVADHVLCAI
jgi:hypothetical protein